MGNGHFASAHSGCAGLEATFTWAVGNRELIASQIAPAPASAITPAQAAICGLFIVRSFAACDPRRMLIPRYECARFGDLGPHGIGILGERNGRRVVLAGLGPIACPLGGLSGPQGGAEPVRLLLQR